MCIRDRRETLTSSLSDSSDKARLQAVRVPHSGDWLNALPRSACGLRLDDNTKHISDVYRVAVRTQSTCWERQCVQLVTWHRPISLPINWVACSTPNPAPSYSHPPCKGNHTKYTPKTNEIWQLWFVYRPCVVMNSSIEVIYLLHIFSV